MNNCVKFFMFVVSVFAVMEMSAQHVSPNIKFRKPGKVVVVNSYHAPQLDKGHSYDVLSMEGNQQRQMQRSVLSNNTGAGYYHSYGISNAGGQRVTYNTHVGINYSEGQNVVTTPFEDVVVTNSQMRVGREDTPDDP